LSETEEYKRQAAERAVEYVEPGMALGLGSGSTAMYALQRLAQLLREGALPGVVGVPSSAETEGEALRLGIPLSTLERHPSLDLTIDGADEVDPALDLIKGGGGALLREKILAEASRRVVIVVEEGKLSPRLGTLSAVPVEVLPFARRPVEDFLKSLGAAPALRERRGGDPFVTGQGNFIFDCVFGPIADAAGLARQLKGRAGVMEHGLFIGLASEVVSAGRGGINHLRKEQ
jgi:ribose 5-phosphate isomerase A